MTDRLRFGEILVRAGALDRGTLDNTLAELGDESADLGEALVQKGLIDESALVDSLSKALGLPTINLSEVSPNDRALDLIPREVCEAHLMLPIEVEQSRTGEHLLVAMANPADVRAIKRATREARLRIRAHVAAAREIRIGIVQFYTQRERAPEQHSKRPSILAASAPSRPPAPARGLDTDLVDAIDQGTVQRLTRGMDLSSPPPAVPSESTNRPGNRDTRAPLAGFRRPATLPPLPPGLESRRQRAERTTNRPTARQSALATTPPVTAPTSRHSMANIGDMAPASTIVDSGPSVDLQRILDRYVGEISLEDDATEDVFEEFLNRFGEAAPTSHEATIAALDEAVSAARSPSSKLILSLVRQLSRRGLIDAPALFSSIDPD